MILALRHLFKNKSYAFINLFGLTLGLIVSLLITLYVKDELSYDKYLAGYDRVIRIQPSIILDEGEKEWATSEGFLVPTISTMYPEIESATRILRHENDVVFKTDAEQYSQPGVIAVDSTFFEVFPFRFIYGDPNTVLDNPDALVLTQSLSKKIFGNIDPVGQLISTEYNTFTVTAVIEDVPLNSHFSFSALYNLKSLWRDVDQSRTTYTVYSYLRLRSPDQVSPFTEKTLKEWYPKYGYPDSTSADSESVILKSKRLEDIHLTSRAEKEFGVNGQIQLIYIFIAAAVLILAIATINYINLSNALAVKRAKEVAIRKTIGASGRKLFLNFLVESYAFTFFAFVLSLTAVVLLIPRFNLFTGKQIDLSVIVNLDFVGIVLLVWMLLGFLAGFYPAMILSSFNPIQALKSGTGSGKSGKVSIYLRRGLIISQFTISSLLIVSAFTIQDQLNFIEDRDIGFNKSNVVIVPLSRDAIIKREALKHEIGKLGAVESSSASSVVPGKRVVILIVRVPELAGTQNSAEGTDDGTRSMRVMSVDHDFVKTMGLQIAEGRDFSIENAADTSEAFLINEAAVKDLNLKDPVGKPFEYVFNDQKSGKIIGVIKDFNFASIHNEIEPLMIHIYPWYNSLCIRIKNGNTPQTITEIESVWKKITSTPFSYYFLDDSYDALYKSEKATGKVITVFMALALTIAGLGLFGIVSFFAMQRTREVGIRKVFGASTGSLLQVLSREYLIMVIAANLIAFYPAWLLVNGWLQQFAYRVPVSLTTFVLAFLVSELLAMISILYILLKTARTNPATTLRYE